MPMWFSAKQPEIPVSKSVATELEATKEHDFYHLKLSDSHYQEQDSSSTLSTDQSHSHHEGSTSAGSDVQMKNVSFQPEYPSHHQVQMEHNQSSDWASYSMAAAAPYFGGRMTAAYDPNAAIYPQMAGVGQARAVLPLDHNQGIPMFVNAKQYHAILRRRQTRAKLEAQNKVARTRKPYLHESRHHHALRRARGSGGRFLNTKKSDPTAQESEVQHSEGSSSWDTSTTSGSDVSYIFNNGDFFQQPRMGTQSHMAARNDMLLLSMDRCGAQIRSTT
ncbi:nuclear transcription factor Y subunit A-7-like isoform X2 [Salvia miltiorrhiza]|nr:nuclear transcription factor Y subunit A-7-like isoform X2 [Salvia miltiorrhiza]XP_057776365.1 nuclear transcription factor Y subunit A-7-like isoform X2 [Salvia miltiorrhiza]XP_057776366.1 nuclear transcription factor Y subunit A-7-like isoform X2 [Salvia miltiorrhiza]XP_057776367.1 nuclear transcription factor Y subunit A-7-like isoform X2 [Salvia miltiorrhiza]XP_057776368.1 nuclear transcription factor Y subunit A-7-like isoform X2 [Salvia miltiorrhiza]XP_057776369.1 nuclear transcriptio